MLCYYKNNCSLRKERSLDFLSKTCEVTGNKLQRKAERPWTWAAVEHFPTDQADFLLVSRWHGAAFSCTFPNKALLQAGCQERDWQFSETITNRGSNRAQQSPTSTVRAWGHLHWRASLGLDTAACTPISIRIAAVLTSATAPEPSRAQTCAGKPNGNEEHLNNELGGESAGN